MVSVVNPTDDNQVEIPNNTSLKDSAYPKQVTYCQTCSLPPEYCEYSPEWPHSQPIQPISGSENGISGQDNNAIHAPLNQTILPTINDPSGTSSLNNDLNTLSLKDDHTTSQHSISTETPTIKSINTSGKKSKAKIPLECVISSVNRTKKKYVTHVEGLTLFNIKLVDAAKLFSKRFAASSTVSKDKDEVVIQGLVPQEVGKFILQTWPDKIQMKYIFFKDGTKLTPMTETIVE